MDELYIYGIGLIGLFIVLFYWYLNSISIESMLIKLKEKNKHTFKPQEPRVLIEDDLNSFPHLIQEYLRMEDYQYLTLIKRKLDIGEI